MRDETNDNSQFAINNSRFTKGYKQTEIGIIPEDWNLISYDTAFNFLPTATYSRADLSTDDEILYVHYGDIHTKLNNFLDLDSFSLPSIDVKKAKKYSLLEEGDLLMADASEDYEGICKSVEVKNVRNKKAISGLHTFLLRDKKKVFANGFRGYIRSNRSVKNQLEKLATGLKVYGVSKSNLKLVLIPLPPIAEQEAIAEVLSDADALINSLDRLIAKKRNLKHGTMQLLLTGKKRLPNFNGDWETKTLGEIGKLRGGNGFPEKYQNVKDEKFPFFKVSDMNNLGNEKLMINSNNYISAETRKKIGAFPFPKNTIIFAKIGAAIFLERKRILKQISCIDNNLMGFILDSENACLDFVFYNLLSIEFGKLVAASALPALSGNEIGEIKIPFPPIEEQKAIAEVLSGMDAEIAALEAKRDKYKALKQGMMQELLTGKTRLI